MSPAVRCSTLTVRRAGRAILGPLDLELESGQLVGIVGPNGAGKTTLLRILAGLERPSGGAVEVSSVRRAVLLQHHLVASDLPFTVDEVVGFGRLGGWRPGRRPGARDRRAVEEALTALGLSGMRRRLYRELSGGEQRKVQLARCLAQEPELLLLDEPSAGLDLEWQERLTALVGALHARTGATVLMVSHEVGRLPAGCSSVLLLREGQRVAFGMPQEVIRPETLRRAYGVEMEVGERDGRRYAVAVGVAVG